MNADCFVSGAIGGMDVVFWLGGLPLLALRLPGVEKTFRDFPTASFSSWYTHSCVPNRVEGDNVPCRRPCASSHLSRFILVSWGNILTLHAANLLRTRCHRCVSSREAAVPNHTNLAALLNNLGEPYSVQGRYAEAEPLLKRSLTISRRVLRPEHRDVSRPLNNLAALYRKMSKAEGASKLEERAKKIRSLLQDHGILASPLNDQQ